jgi:2-polyprenyl-3-methyl-5-hydroxy-6-metoxy-1,4-benzoquinol methylase
VTVCRDKPLRDIVALVAAGERTIDVLDPDLHPGCYAGERVEHGIHRPFRVWVDLAERLGLRLLTPRAIEPPLIRLTFAPLDRSAMLRPRGDYGSDSEFARISKLEDPCFLIDFAEAIARCPPPHRILDLGVNTGDELELLPAAEIVGVDHSISAIAVARERFPRATFHVADINALPDLGKEFDLVVCLATLQSPTVDDREVLRRIVQHHLTPRGAVILGIPNCRYVDGEIEYGARVVNRREPELGLLVKDLAFYRKYLQQHHRQVFVTGKHYVLVTAIPE